jgi:DNA-binding CsgD family transcriptional regulator
LTQSERRVLDLVRAGLPYREIGERLFISRRTVETHAYRIFRKLGVRTRAELAALELEDT